MDTLILGLLMFQQLTVYEIKTFLGEGMYLMYSDSIGSIQAAVKKLLNNGWASYQEQVDDGKYKKIYSLTEQGKSYFMEWLEEPMQPGTAPNRVLTKVFFMGMLPKEKREALLWGHVKILEQKLETLKQTKKKAQQITVTKDQKEIAAFQIATIDLGMDSVGFEIEWYQRLIKSLREDAML